MERYRVTILAGGRGARFGDKSELGHKALFRVGTKAVISHIIDLFPNDVTFVIALGFNGHLIEQYLELFHPERHFIYVQTENYGKGYGPGYALNECRHRLECPFYFFACDTIVSGFVNDETADWVGWSTIDCNDSSEYCTLKIDEDTFAVEKYFDKEKDGTEKAWIGLAFIRDYTAFWAVMQTNTRLLSGEIQLSPALSAMNMQAREIPGWYDTGNEVGLQRAQLVFPGLDNLDKPGEEIYFASGSVLKYFHDPQMVTQRVARAQTLGDIVPSIEAVSRNFYRYTFVDGNDLTRIDRPDLHIVSLLEFSRKRLWKDIALSSDEHARFRLACREFYYEKTVNRIEQLYRKLSWNDEECVINGFRVPALNKVIDELIDWDWLCDGLPSTFHGDFNLSNLLLANDGSFRFVDFRQDFAGSPTCGDRYYDLAKLYQGFIWPHVSVRQDMFDVHELAPGSFEVAIDIPNAVEECRRLMEEWSTAQLYEVRRIQILAALTLVNIAPLHEERLSRHLYLLGRYHLSQLLPA